MPSSARISTSTDWYERRRSTRSPRASFAGSHEARHLRRGTGRGLHRRLVDLQRHDRTGRPAARDGVRGLLVLQGDHTFCPLGPWIVTPDEIDDPHNLAMELRVNGEPRQASHSSRMSVTIPEI